MARSQPGGKVIVCEANRLKYKGNWKLAYDNSGDGYHVVYSHRSLLETENRLAEDGNKGMAFYRSSPDTAPMYMQYMGNGHHFKDKRPNLNKRPGGLWAIESPHPGMEHCESAFKQRYGDRLEPGWQELSHLASYAQSAAGLLELDRKIGLFRARMRAIQREKDLSIDPF